MTLKISPGVIAELTVTTSAMSYTIAMVTVFTCDEMSKAREWAERYNNKSAKAPYCEMIEGLQITLANAGSKVSVKYAPTHVPIEMKETTRPVWN